MIQTLWPEHILLKCFSLIANVNFLHHRLNKMKHCLVIGWPKYLILKFNSWQLFNPIHYIPFFKSYLTLSRWICFYSHLKLQWINCDNVRNIEGVWINFCFACMLWVFFFACKQLLICAYLSWFRQNYKHCNIYSKCTAFHFVRC